MTIAPLRETDVPPRSVPFAADLAGFGDRVACATAGEEITYRDLADRVDEVGRRLGPRRRLVLVAGANTLDALVGYLAALAGGHPALLVPGDNPATVAALVAAYDPDVVLRGDHLTERRAGTAHDLHPDLALLLTTSGSTGSAKVVRLSHDNLQANAEAIATYLGIRETDRAATTLPLHYCYGLSVVNSHLLRGAALILTDLSVADACFWDLFRQHRGTSLAGVPYTFELLDRVGFDRMDLPHLRYLTQAGGRMPPERVRRYAELGRRRGFDLYVMYGQTEATARMAYLPPDLAASHPECVGIPIPGGSFRLDPQPEWPDPDAGELVYAGPNVMLGYARTAADLASGRTVHELRTGDIARHTPDGLYQIVGRRSRFVKLYGLRIDLRQVEDALGRHGVTACCAGGDDELVVAVETGRPEDPAGLRDLIARECRLPARPIRVRAVAALPRLPNGKPDYAAVRALAAAPEPEPPPAPPGDLVALFGAVLGRSDVTEDSTFVGLGGDSLSYVEMSIRLEQALGRLPEVWHTTPIRDLRAELPPRGRPRARPRRTLDTAAALRAVAIVCVVGTHAGLLAVAGGAHLLLGVAGFNFARFHLTGADRADRTRRIGRSVRRIALPAAVWIAFAVALTDDYSPANVVLLNYVVGTETGNGWHFWFLESLVYILLALAALLAVPALDRVERRHPYALPLGLVVLALVPRYDLFAGVVLPTPIRAFWLFALGWAAAKAATTGQRLAVTAAILATVPGFFGSPQREALVAGGLVLLVWVSRLPSTATLNRAAGVLAGASLYLYLTHWQVYPHLTGRSPALAAAASLAVGIAYAALVNRTARLARRLADRTVTRRIRSVT
jgi:acyl-CoA synthetase (AMP-forming)/AMP-acid ligase II